MQQAKKTDAKGDPLLPCLLLGEPCPDCKAKNECTRFFSLFRTHRRQDICSHTTERGPFWKSVAKRSAFAFFYDM